MSPRDRTSTRRSAHVRGHPGARRLAQAVALCLAAAGACKAGHKPKTEDHFYQLARAELAAGESCPRTREYLDTLSPAERLDLARAIVRDRDTRVSYLGVDILIRQGSEDEAVPVLAARVADGHFEALEGRLAYEWVHDNPSKEDPTFARLILKISRHLLTHLVTADHRVGGSNRS